MFDLIILLTLLLIGYGFGTYNERRHFRSIQEREEEMQDILAFTTRHPPADTYVDVCLAAGSVVISIDYFKKDKPKSSGNVRQRGIGQISVSPVLSIP